MSNKTFKKFINELNGNISYVYYTNMVQLMTPYQRTFLDCYISVKELDDVE